MTKILEQEGYKYSREQFDGYTYRAKFRLSVSDDWREDTNIDIYTDNPNKIDVLKVVSSKKTEKVKLFSMEHWTTKEQDDLTAQFIEETLKDI
jgi:hypothetical protein